jgi:hypothetical protein
MAEKAEIVVVTGLEQTIKALRQWDKTALRRFNKVINDNLSKAESDARRIIDFVGNSYSATPMRGWKATYGPSKPSTTTRGQAGWPAWVPANIKKGIQKSRAQGRVRADYTTSAGSLVNKSAAGAIFEVAGRESSGKGKRGQQFVRNLKQWGNASRLIWRIVDRDRDRIVEDVIKAQRQANELLQKRFNEAGR